MSAWTKNIVFDPAQHVCLLGRRVKRVSHVSRVGTHRSNEWEGSNGRKSFDFRSTLRGTYIPNRNIEINL
jgi:hypothetical protein